MTKKYLLMVGCLSLVLGQYNLAIADENCEETCNQSFEECYNGTTDEDCIAKQTACLEKCAK